MAPRAAGVLMSGALRRAREGRTSSSSPPRTNSITMSAMLLSRNHS
jgi:hypothetical protein